MRPIIILLVFVLTSLKLFATAQYPDQIFYNEKKYDLYSNPLEVYFEKNPDKRPKAGVMSTALWRGYVATFEVRDNQIFLKDIEIQIWNNSRSKTHDTKWKSVINEVFPNQKDIKIDWLTGLLIIPRGKLINYIHMGYGSTYENYILLEFENGNFKKSKWFNHNQYEHFKEKQFQAFKKTDEYNKLVEKLKQDGNSIEFIDSFLKNFVIEYTSKILTED